MDRPLRDVRAITDGTRKYRLAAWAPRGSLVALVPQDGPGMDVVDAGTGTVSAVVTDTYVLEPRWTDTGDLLVHRVEQGRDTLTLWSPRRGLAPEPLVAGPALSAPSYTSGWLVFARDGKLWSCRQPCAAPQALAASGALVTALSSALTGTIGLAWTPEVANLEDVQTFLVALSAQAPAGPLALSMPGEGWWLPRWSPDGKRLVMTSIGGRIAVATADGSERQDLGPGDSPVWSPDGRWIAYAGASAGLEYTSRDLHLVPADGGGRRLRLTDAGEEQFFVSPTWSPDGTRLAFVEIDSGKLYVGTISQP